MAITKEIAEKIQEIKTITGLKINTYKIIDTGAESIIIEINNTWIFRFPRSGALTTDTHRRWNFLSSFAKVSPIPIPRPMYITDHMVGYKKLSGERYNLGTVEKLIEKERQKIAKQFGLFLKALHTAKDRHINFATGYLVMRKGDYQNHSKELAKYLTIGELKVLDTKLKAIAENPSNFIKLKNIIHGDLNFNNILWDKNKKVITGILDWSDMGLGVPAMDFIALADFTKDTNDQFLKDILRWYGTKDDKLFVQIKENVIIEVMNWFWFYLKANKTTGVTKITKKLKQLLKAPTR